jgi:hypothetical protein
MRKNQLKSYDTAELLAIKRTFREKIADLKSKSTVENLISMEISNP